MAVFYTARRSIRLTRGKVMEIDLLDRSEIMKTFKMSRTSLYLLCRDGRFPKPRCHVGRRALWTRQQLEAFIKSGGSR